MSDGSGEVIEVGEGVTEFSVGDHVISRFSRIGYRAIPMLGSAAWREAVWPRFQATPSMGLLQSTLRSLLRLLLRRLRDTRTQKPQR